MGLILDNASKDGGDSANRAGLLAIAGDEQLLFVTRGQELLNLYHKGGICVRHPSQVPWNNPKNFTRDQLLPLTAGLYAQRRYSEVRDIFWAHAKRFFFCQNSERDVVGSTKYPWPHSFINDKGVKETRMFDFADPLWPNDIWHLIKAGRMWYLYWFAIIGIPCFLFALGSHCEFYKGDDEGQMIAACYIQGPWALRMYRTHRKGWISKLESYWNGWRNQPEISSALYRLVDRA